MYKGLYRNTKTDLVILHRPCRQKKMFTQEPIHNGIVLALL